MEQTFYFVDGIKANRASKKELRRHVMKGKNLGKRLQRPSRVKPKERHLPNSPKRIASIDLIAHTDHYGLMSSSMPGRMTPDTLQIIHRFYSFVVHKVYPSQLGLLMVDAKRLWLEPLFADTASFHCGISMMQTCNEIMLGKTARSPVALYHQSCAYLTVNQKLQGEEALLDSTLWLVVILINQEQLTQRHDISNIHLKGLERLIELRGGLSKLEPNAGLVLKICKADIMFSIQTGQSPMFFRDVMSEIRPRIIQSSPCLEQRTSYNVIQADQVDMLLKEVLRDSLEICTYFNDKNKTEFLTVLEFMEIVLSIFYRLLAFRLFSGPIKNTNNDTIYHAGLGLFMMTVFLQSRERRPLRYDMASKYVFDVVHRLVAEDGRNDELILWFLALVGIWELGDDNTYWVVPMIQERVKRLGIKSWAEFRAVVSKRPWLNALHNDLGHRLWDQIEKNIV